MVLDRFLTLLATSPRKTVTGRRAAIVASGALILVACGEIHGDNFADGQAGEGPGTSRPPDGTMIARDVIVVRDEVARSLTVGAGQLSFVVSPINESLMEVAPGAVLISGAGDGFIRRVREVVVDKGIGSSLVTFLTEAATVLDLYIESESENCVPFSFGASNQGTVDGGGTARGAATFNVGYQASPMLCIEWAIHDGQLEAFEAVVEESAILSGETTLSLTAGEEFTASRSFPLGMPVRAFIPLPGLIPVRVDIALRIVARIDASAEAGILATKGFVVRSTRKYGLRFSNGIWSEVDEASRLEWQYNPEPIVNGVATARVTVGVGPVLDVDAFGIGGPSFGVEARLTMDFEACPQLVPPMQWSLSGDAAGQVSGRLFDAEIVGPYDLATVGVFGPIRGPAVNAALPCETVVEPGPGPE